MNYRNMLNLAYTEAQAGFDEGGVPVGAALFDADGKLLGLGRNRRVQDNDPSVHGETDAFRKAGRQTNYRDKILVTTLAPCWYCSGLIRQFNIGTVVVGESQNFAGHLDWLREAGVNVIELNDTGCTALMRRFIEESPHIWFEDIGECTIDNTHSHTI
ncbi:MAG: tRNA-specific adenosine deaminase [Methylomonas sp.]|nr:MAG: tRNA-specific adenosine deaminase [Methylomonas sp.]